MQLSPNFSLEELTASGTASRLGIANQPGPVELEALRALCSAVLQPLRDGLGRGVKVTSAFRGPELNRAVKGVGKSQHLSGEAADLQAPGMTVADLFKAVVRLKLPFDQLIYEDKGASRWVHVSHVAAGPNRGQMLLAKFGPGGSGPVYTNLSEAQAMQIAEPVSRDIFGEEPGYEEGPDEPPEHLPPPPPAAATPAPAVSTVVPAAPAASAAAAPQGKKTAAKKATAKKSAAKASPATKTPAKEVPRKPPAAKKVAAKKAAAKPAQKTAKAKAEPGKAVVAKKAVARKAAASQLAKPKTAVKKTAVKLAAITEPAAKKAVPKKAAPKKAAPKKTPPKKPASKATVSKGPAKPAPTAKAAGKKVAARRR